MKPCALALVLLFFTAGCAMAQEPPSADAPAPQQDQAAPVADAPPAAPAPAADPKIDQLLDALDARGKDLNSFTAAVSLADRDPGLGQSLVRRGTVLYQKVGEDDARIRVNFTEVEEDGQRSKERREYVLENGRLVEREYETRRQVTRQVLRPGETLNLLRLGEGPFPLPIGQDKAEVHRLFEVSLLDPARTDPPNTTRLRLIPRVGTHFAQQFERIDVWVDHDTSMPRRITTLDINQVSLRTTDLTDVEVNVPLRDDDFRLEKIDPRRWNLIDEPYRG
jgi:hypothetical protein